MVRKTKTLRRWLVLVQNQIIKIFECPTNKKLEVVEGEDLFGPIKKYYDFDSKLLLSDRQRLLKVNKLKTQGYVEENSTKNFPKRNRRTRC
jgi:hypothetical protein